MCVDTTLVIQTLDSRVTFVVILGELSKVTSPGVVIRSYWKYKLRIFFSVRGEALIYGHPAGCRFISVAHIMVSEGACHCFTKFITNFQCMLSCCDKCCFGAKPELSQLKPFCVEQKINQTCGTKIWCVTCICPIPSPVLKRNKRLIQIGLNAICVVLTFPLLLSRISGWRPKYWRQRKTFKKL